MPLEFHSLSDLLDHDYDTVIDVRSPAEFAEDHFPGAINLPSLSNDQRAEVGTIYKQVSPFKARTLGAGMVIRNIADHIDGPLADKDGSWRPLVYCWRGGQRSGVFRTILSEVGWRAESIKGGYQSYRRLVSNVLYDTPLPHQFILLDGYTGTAKTQLLQRLAARDVQVVDLEGLARHRGSLLGGRHEDQPSQKAFDSALALALHGCDPDRPVVLEAESSKIGRINLPKSLWVAMCDAPRIVVDAPVAARARYLASAYHEVIADADRLARRLAPLRSLRGHEQVDNWIALSRAKEFEALSAQLVTQHYDPAYAKSRAQHRFDLIATIQAERLDDGGLESAADGIVSAIRKWSARDFR